MYKDILQNTENLAIWPVISFVIFFLFFLILVWWAFTADRRYIKEMSSMPLDDNKDIKAFQL
jgi:cytochrome c oxidase cbb3-type subunit 4